jgi:hypothetical protein
LVWKPRVLIEMKKAERDLHRDYRQAGPGRSRRCAPAPRATRARTRQRLAIDAVPIRIASVGRSLSCGLVGIVRTRRSRSGRRKNARGKDSGEQRKGQAPHGHACAGHSMCSADWSPRRRKRFWVHTPSHGSNVVTHGPDLSR